MNTNKIVKQIAPNIWRITRWVKEPENRKSLFVTEPKSDFSPVSEFSCQEAENGLLKFFLNGKMVLSEMETSFTQGFSIGEDDGIYGLGMNQSLGLNRRGSVCQMIQRNDHITAVPFFTSTGGYAVLFDSCAYMSIGIDKVCTSELVDNYYDTDEKAPNTIQVYADDAQEFTYYVILGESMQKQIEGFRALTGKSTLFAKWVYGFFQCRCNYKTQKEVLEIAAKFRDMHIPIDCIVQDWHYWGDLGWNAVEWDENLFPDPDGMIQKLHDMKMKLMISVWPSFGPMTNIAKELEEAKGVFHTPDPKNQEPWGTVYDPYNEKAFDIVWRYMNGNLLSKGVDAWWLDSTEPAFDSDCSSGLLKCNPCALGNNRRILNSFALKTSKNVYEAQRKETNDKRVMILTRSGYAGQQAVGTVSWTGDISASWKVFRTQLQTLLSYSVSGIPYSTTDIGAFTIYDNFDSKTGKKMENATENPEYREMYTRWYWFGAFSPVFRSHGASAPREMWFFGDPGTEYFDGQLAADKLRYSLMPYIYAAAFDVYDRDRTLMRPLVMDFPKDKKVANMDDTYLFGPSLLVHIVTEYQKRKAEVYLPEGCQWINFFTGERFSGGQTVIADAPMNQTPLFVKAGSILLMTEPEENTADQSSKLLQLHLYRGADAETFHYVDDGDNYTYEQGNYAKIPMHWNEADSILKIGAAEGKAENFELPEKFEIYLGNKLVQTVSYDGKDMEVSLA